MAIYGYIQQQSDGSCHEIEMAELLKRSCNKIFIENNESVKTKKVLKQLLGQLKKDDVVVVNELSSFDCRIRQFGEVIKDITEHEAYLQVIKENIDTTEEEDYVFLTYLSLLNKMDQKVLREQTMIGIQEAREEGRIGGRPKVSPEVIELIEKNYYQMGLTMREIGEKVGVSLGTVQKYVQKSELLAKNAVK